METELPDLARWDTLGLPHKGWQCVEFHDNGYYPAESCEMCGTDIRYAHIMEHKDVKGRQVTVGAICAEAMCESYKATEIERRHVNTAKRRKNWLVRKWKRTERGSRYVTTEGFRVLVFRTEGGWKASVEDGKTRRRQTSFRVFPNIEEAQIASFDALQKYKAEWRS